MAVGAITLGALTAGMGLYEMYQGSQAKKQAERDQQEAIDRLEGTDIRDFNRPAMNQLLMRSRQGLPEESMTYAERGAERAAGAALGSMEDRRMGLAGIGQAQQSLSDTYTQLASMDAQQRLANEQNYIAAQQQEAQQAYQQEMDLANTQLALARANRLEGNEQRNAGLQNAFQGVGLASYALLPKTQPTDMKKAVGESSTPATIQNVNPTQTEVTGFGGTQNLWNTLYNFPNV